MIGIGSVFEAYRDGRLMDDDEVALCHAPAELRYAPLSEPMVNIRATLTSAHAAGLLSETAHLAALRIGRGIHYKDRTWDELMDRLEAEGLELGNFRDWLRTGRVDQKALDAEALLKAIVCGVQLPPHVGIWHFEHTAMWNELVQLHGTSGASAHPAKADLVLRRLKSHPDKWRAVLETAIGRMLASDAAKLEGKNIEEDELLSALEHLRRTHHLDSPSDLQKWLEANDLETDGLIELLANQVRLNWMISNLEPHIEPHMLEHLKVTGNYQ